MHNNQQTAEETTTELKIQFFNFHEQAKNSLIPMDNTLHTTVGTMPVY